MKGAITIGADPELFVIDGDEPVPVIGKLGGTKDQPIRVECGAVQEDNVLAEFNIDPAHTEKEFIHNINTVMGEMQARLPKFELRIASSLHFSQEILMKAGKQAIEFGCNPDLNAWTGGLNKPPNPYTTLRTAGGHVHVGYDVPDMNNRLEVIKMMDILIGIPSVILDPDRERRRMYGRAGACRVKDYGVEYRVLSNFWLQNEKLMSWVYRHAVESVENIKQLPEYLKGFDSDTICDTINNSNRVKAAEIIDTLSLAMP